MVQVVCFKCRESLSFADRIGRGDECPNCRSDLHVCKNCEHYDAASYNECRESSADVVREKERSNFCDYFVASHLGKKTGPSSEDLQAAAEALFRKKS